MIPQAFMKKQLIAPYTKLLSRQSEVNWLMAVYVCQIEIKWKRRKTLARTQTSYLPLNKSSNKKVLRNDIDKQTAT